MRNAKDHVPFLFLVYKELQGPAIAMKKELANLKADEEAIVRVSISALERYAWLTVLRKNSQRLAPGTHDLLEESGHNLNTLHLNVSFMLPLSPLSMESIGRITKDTGCDVCQKQDANICVGCRSAQYCGKGKLLLRRLRTPWLTIAHEIRVPAKRLATAQSRLQGRPWRRMARLRPRRFPQWCPNPPDVQHPRIVAQNARQARVCRWRVIGGARQALPRQVPTRGVREVVAHAHVRQDARFHDAVVAG